VHIEKISVDKSCDLYLSSESRWVMRTGESLDLSTFGAVGDEP